MSDLGIWDDKVPKWLSSLKFGGSSITERCLLYLKLGVFELSLSTDPITADLPSLTDQEKQHITAIHRVCANVEDLLAKQKHSIGVYKALGSGTGSGLSTPVTSGDTLGSTEREQSVVQPLAHKILDAMAGLFGGGCVWDKRGEGTTGEKYADLHTTVGKDINLTEAITRAGIFEPDYTISFAHEVTAAKTLDMAHVAVQQLSYAARFFRVIIGKDVRLTAPNVYNIPILPSDDIETFFIIGRILKYQAGKSTSKKVIRTVVPVFDSANVEPNVKSGDGAGGPGGRPLRGGFSDGNHSGSSGHSTSGTSNSGKSRNGKYVVGEFLGSGSTFAVWQIGMGDFDGVIKAEIRGGAAVVEAYVLRQLNGIRGVPKLVDEVYYDGVPAVVVSPRGKRLGSADHSSVMDMIVNLLRTLRDVHGRGIVCNDVSLENIVVAESSSDSAVESDVPAKTYVLVDWGFATPAYSTSFNPNPPCHPVFASPRLFTEYPIVRAPADDIVSVFLVAAKMVQSVLPWEVDRGEGWSQNQRLNLKGAEIFVDGALAEGYDWALSLGRVGGTVIDYDAFIRSLTVL